MHIAYLVFKRRKKKMERAAKAEQGKSKVTEPSEPKGWVGGRPTLQILAEVDGTPFLSKDLGLPVAPLPPTRFSDLPAAL
jgi:hypothetical protein